MNAVKALCNLVLHLLNILLHALRWSREAVPYKRLMDYSGSKLMQIKEQINVKRGLNLAAKPWTQFNYNVPFEINGKIIDGNVHQNYVFFTA